MATESLDGRWGDGGEDRDGTHGDGSGALVPAWLTSLAPMLPEVLFAPYDPGRARFCFKKLGVSEHCGLICCSEPALAEAYMAACLTRSGFCEVRRLSLDEACDLARDRYGRADSVILIDDPHRPVVQTVC